LPDVGCQCRRVSRAHSRVVRRAGRGRQCSHDGQRVLLRKAPVPGDDRHPRPTTSAHASLHAPYERQSGALHPDRAPRMGVRQTLSLLTPASWRTAPISHNVQLHATSHCPSPPASDQPSFRVTTSPVTTASVIPRSERTRDPPRRTATIRSIASAHDPLSATVQPVDEWRASGTASRP
jgi:hypothetical protein